eukprot:tig00000448_g901.t1
MAELPPAHPSPYHVGIPRRGAPTRTFDPGVDPVGQPNFTSRVRIYPSGTVHEDVPPAREVRGSQLRWMPLESVGTEPAGRFAHAMATCRGKVYMFGGLDEDGAAVEDLDVVELAMAAHGARSASLTATWSRPPARGERPRGRWGHSLCALGPRLYVFGGTNGRELFNDVYIYDTEMRAWLKPLVDAPAGAPEPRMGHTARAAARPSWAPRESTAAAYYGASLVVLGGLNRAGRPVADAWALDIGEELSWRRLDVEGLERCGQQLQGCAAATTDGELVFVTGGGGPATPASPMETAFLEFRPPRRPLAVGAATLGDPPPMRAMHSAAAAGHRVAVYGGRNTDILADLHVLDTGTMEWHRPRALSPEFAPPALLMHASAAVGDKLVIFGGVSWAVRRPRPRRAPASARVPTAGAGRAAREEGAAIFVSGEAYVLASLAGATSGPAAPGPGHLSAAVAGLVSDALDAIRGEQASAGALAVPLPARSLPSAFMRLFLPYPPFSTTEAGAGATTAKSVKRHHAEEPAPAKAPDENSKPGGAAAASPAKGRPSIA